MKIVTIPSWGRMQICWLRRLFRLLRTCRGGQSRGSDDDDVDASARVRMFVASRLEPERVRWPFERIENFILIFALGFGEGQWRGSGQGGDRGERARNVRGKSRDAFFVLFFRTPDFGIGITSSPPPLG